MADAALETRFSALDDFLSAHAWLWREQPFRIARPGWVERLPQLATTLLEMGDEVEGLLSDTPALIDFMSSHVPAFAALPALLDLPAANDPPPAPRAFIDWAVPGRKWRQIERFAHAVGEVVAPVTEWCAGKGHLGRLVGARAGAAVTSLEINEQLCEAGRALGARARVEQHFWRKDVLNDDVAEHLRGRHVLGLHACGELHRTLVRQARSHGVAAVDIAPCCYHLSSGGGGGVRGRGLALSPDDLRLAVTETVTASGREVRVRDLAHAWRLGYLALRSALFPELAGRGLKPIRNTWLALGFEGFCRRLAERDQLRLPGAIAWAKFEAIGFARHHEVLRLSVPRFAVRRAIEVWLACDLALCLQDQGYVAGVEEFCPREDTPRNLRVFARETSRGAACSLI